MCQICFNNVESISHALLGCKMAKKVWRDSQFAKDFPGEQFQDIGRLIQALPK